MRAKGWRLFEEEKPKYGQLVICAGEPYETTEGESVDYDIAKYVQYDYSYHHNEKGELIPDKKEDPHFESETNYGEWVDEPMYWMPIPSLPKE